MLHQALFLGLECIQFLVFRRDQFVEGRQAVGDFLLFRLRRNRQRQLGELLITNHLAVAQPLKILIQLSNESVRLEKLSEVVRCVPMLQS
ncbi:hypothetical protein WS69_29570 [Burkholderia sp. BDU5]|nr:hypothetical protein WS69_29570 [Burkholderia sp. BDU5]